MLLLRHLMLREQKKNKNSKKGKQNSLTEVLASSVSINFGGHHYICRMSALVESHVSLCSNLIVDDRARDNNRLTRRKRE